MKEHVIKIVSNTKLKFTNSPIYLTLKILLKIILFATKNCARNSRKFCTKIDPTIYNFAKGVKRNFGINASERCFRTEGEDWKLGYVWISSASV